MRIACDQSTDPVALLRRLEPSLPVRLWLRLSIAGGEIPWDITGPKGLECLRLALQLGELGPVTISAIETQELAAAA